jgi:hypothetical protein
MQENCRLFLSKMPEAETLGILLKNNTNNFLKNSRKIHTPLQSSTPPS